MEDDSIVTPEEAPETEPEADKPAPEEGENEDAAKKEKPNRSEIAQKIKWRERALKAEGELSKADTLKAELEELRSLVKKPDNDQEAKAQEYIREQARKVYEDLKNAERREKEKTTREFESAVESLLDENPDVSEEELLDTIEELEVEPEVALRILKRQATAPKEKPRMPSAKRGAPETSPPKADDSKKSMWQILQEETQKLKG